MRVLIDTNIFVRAAQLKHPLHDVALIAPEILRKQGHLTCIVPQVCYELWVVLTRPIGENGLGLTSTEAASELGKLNAPLFAFLDDNADVFAHWRDLVSAFKVTGKASHDTRLAAAMLAHDCPAILTFDVHGFNRYNVNVLDPRSLAAQP